MRGFGCSIFCSSNLVIASGVTFLSCLFVVPLRGQTIYWTQPDGVYRRSLPAGETETLILQNHQP